VKSPGEHWWGLPQTLRFLIVGGYNTAFGYLAFTVFFLTVGQRIHYLIVGLAAHAVAAVNAFVVHRLFVFRSAKGWVAEYLRFNLSQLAALSFGMAALYSLVSFGHLNPLVAQAIVVSASVVLSYALHRFFTFRDSA
jgi:putative flippase GtrA